MRSGTELSQFLRIFLPTFVNYITSTIPYEIKVLCYMLPNDVIYLRITTFVSLFLFMAYILFISHQSICLRNIL